MQEMKNTSEVLRNIQEIEELQEVSRVDSCDICINQLPTRTSGYHTCMWMKEHGIILCKGNRGLNGDSLIKNSFCPKILAKCPGFRPEEA